MVQLFFVPVDAHVVIDRRRRIVLDAKHDHVLEVVTIRVVGGAVHNVVS
jgi:hypothetical protein